MTKTFEVIARIPVGTKVRLYVEKKDGTLVRRTGPLESVEVTKNGHEIVKIQSPRRKHPFSAFRVENIRTVKQIVDVL